MANDVNRLIDMIYERIEDAKSPALKPSMSMVDRDELLDLLDELRAQLPVEIKRAQELLSARDKFVDDAKRDVERMMRQAELDAKAKVSDSEVLYAAKEKARQMVARAEDRCRQLYQVTNEYAEDALPPMLEAAVDGLNPGGRLAVITFHSLEDRIVKRTLADLAKGCTCPPEFPVCVCGRKPRVRLVNRKPVTADGAELADNPRARSAKLRVAEKCDPFDI